MIEERGIKLNIKPGKISKRDEVFYNPEMVLNRDISVAALKVFAESTDFKNLEVCEPLSASGIRGLRYFKEVGRISKIVLNDVSKVCYKKIVENIKLNKMPLTRFEIYNEDGNILLLRNKKRFHYVDIDPFGSPIYYLFSAALSLKNGSLLGITATDLGALAGTYKEACMRRYNVRVSRTSFAHELGLRALIKSVIEVLAIYNLKFSPVLSFYHRHYYRVFGKVFESAKGANKQIKKIRYLAYCRKCDFRAFGESSQCVNCGGEIENLGPIWSGELGRKDFCERVKEFLAGQSRANYTNAEKLLRVLKNDLEIDIPYYNSHYLAHINKSSSLRIDEIIKGLEEFGFKGFRTHFTPLGFKTNAPLEKINKIFEKRKKG